MKLSQPPPDAPSRAHRALDDVQYVAPGQRLPTCEGHGGVSICTDVNGRRWQPGSGTRAGGRQEVSEFPTVCWDRTWRRKHDLVHLFSSLRWRRDGLQSGYRRLATFEAAAHWWICLGAPDADHLDCLRMRLNPPDCTCPTEYREWFHQMLNGEPPIPPTIFSGATGEHAP